MIDFNRDDIELLNWIINSLKEKGANGIRYTDLATHKSLSHNDAELRFDRLFHIIDSYGCAKCIPETDDSEYSIIKYIPVTAKFITDGGFDKVYEDLVKYQSGKLNDESIQDLTIKSLKLNVFSLKYWWVILLLNAIISFLISYFT